MLDFTSRPELKKYIKSFKADTPIFLEGDASQDLYVLISGGVDLIKGDKKISEINEPGSLFGEMSFLLRNKRSATVKARNDVDAMVIPSGEVSDFLEESPNLAPEISRLLAKRLFETTKVAHCYKEFCDQLPDAVVMTDKDLKIIAWNAAAEKLYGRSWNQMRDKSINEIYDSQAVFQQFMEEIKTQKTVRERPLKIVHPYENWRFVSTSTTALYDGHQKVDGYMFLGRDATMEQRGQKKQQQMRNWMLPAIAVIAVLSTILASNFPDFSRGKRLLEHRKSVFTGKLATDYPSLANALSGLVAEGKLADTTPLMEDYFARNHPGLFGIKGLVLLDTDKKVINAYSPAVGAKTGNILGGSYGEMQFTATKGAKHMIISPGKNSGKSPGANEVEIAFRLNSSSDFLGWLVFQLDTKQLQEDFGIATNEIKSLHLVRP